MPRADKLTIKQAKLVKGIAEGKTKQAAAMEAYNAKTPETASAIASETLKNPKVQEALQAELARQGITLEAVVKPVVNALNATIKSKDINGEVYDTSIPDLDMQLKGHDRAMKILNVNQKEEGGGNTIIFSNSTTFNAGKYRK